MSKLNLSNLLILLALMAAYQAKAWGFQAHQQINRLAVFCLPPEMFGFYKQHLSYISDHAVDPDKRRYLVAGEDVKHYIDLDIYEKVLPIDSIPFSYKQALEKFGSDSLQLFGLVPWVIQWKLQSLTEAFIEKNKLNILKISAEIGHYIADAHVPLHTTSNYNGQNTQQHGIHGFFESRLPEMFMNDYDFFVGTSFYLNQPLLYTWEAIAESYRCLDSVFYLERLVQTETKPSLKYSFEPRGTALVKVYSKEISEKYHQYLNGMVERRMQAAIKAVSCFWYTAWVNGGQPSLQPFTLLPNDTIDPNLEKAGGGKMLGRQETE